MEFPFSIITGKVIHDIVNADFPRAVECVKQAYLMHEAGDSINPDSYFLRFPEKPNARIIALPAHLGGGENVSGIKWIASFPDNIRHGFPRASAVMILNDCETGYPFACLESSIISALRTAASAMLAADYLVPGGRKVTTMGFVGNGLIARHIYQVCLGTGWEIDEVALFDLEQEDSARFAAEVCEPERHGVRICRSLENLIRTSDLVVFATTAARPHVDDFSWFSHNPVILHISLRDLSPDILLASNNVVDDIDHVMNAETSPHLAERARGNRDFVNGTIGQLLLGQCVLADGCPTIFSPFGMGILDIAIAKWIYGEATQSGRAIDVENFFYELRR